MKFFLNYQTEKCRCGGVRTLALPCPECGLASPRNEINRHVVQRRQGLVRVQSYIDDVEGPERTQIGELTPDHLTKQLNSLLVAVSQFASSPTSERSISSLATAVIDLRSTRLALQPTLRVRPGFAQRAGYVESLVRIEQVWEAYRAALSSKSIAEAQLNASMAQAIMDSASQPVADAAVTNKLWVLLSDSSTPLPHRMVAAFTIMHPDSSLSDLHSEAGHLAKIDVGFEVGNNSGLALLLMNPVIATTMDPQAFREKLASAHPYLPSRERVGEIALTDDAVSALVGTHRFIVEAAVAFNAVMESEPDENAIARRLGKLLSEVYEASSPAFAWYVLASKQDFPADAFARLLDKSSTELVTQLLSGPFALLFNDAATYLRNAPVHGRSLDFDSSNRNFVISLRSHKEIIPEGEFANRALAFFETVLASIWLIENALELNGQQLQLSDADSEYLGLTPLALTAMSLGAVSGLAVRSYEQNANGWLFIVEENEDVLMPALVAAQNAAGTVSTVTVRSDDKEPLIVQLSDCESWMRSVGHDMMLGLVAFKASATQSGRSLLTRSDMQFMLSGLGLALLNGEIQLVPHLRRLRSWSTERGWRAEVDTANEIMAAIRGPEPDGLANRLAQWVVTLDAPCLPKGSSVEVVISTVT